MFLNGYPYTDFHEMNLDFLLKSMETLKQSFSDFTASNSLIFAEPLLHNITSSYAKNTIVLDPDGNAYISLQNVPSGVQLSNADYWLMVFNFEEYTEKANKNFTVNYFRDTTRAPYALSVGDWCVLNDVLYTVTQAIAADELLVPGTNLTHFTVEQFLKDFITSINQTVLQYKNDIDASELAYRQQLAQDIANTTASLQAQLDAAISGTTVDSEVINARVGADGVTYPTLGDAIRTQIGNADTLIKNAGRVYTVNETMTRGFHNIDIETTVGKLYLIVNHGPVTVSNFSSYTVSDYHSFFYYDIIADNYAYITAPNSDTKMTFYANSAGDVYFEIFEIVGVNNLIYEEDKKVNNIHDILYVSNETIHCDQNTNYTGKIFNMIYLEAGTYIVSCEQSAQLTAAYRNRFFWNKFASSDPITYESGPWLSNQEHIAAGDHSWQFTVPDNGYYYVSLWVQSISTACDFSKFTIAKVKDTYKNVFEQNYDRFGDFIATGGDQEFIVAANTDTTLRIINDVELLPGRYYLSLSQDVTLSSITRNLFKMEKIVGGSVAATSWEVRSDGAQHLAEGIHEAPFIVSEKGTYRFSVWCKTPSADIRFSKAFLTKTSRLTPLFDCDYINDYARMMNGDQPDGRIYSFRTVTGNILSINHWPRVYYKTGAGNSTYFTLTYYVMLAAFPTRISGSSSNFLFYMDTNSALLLDKETTTVVYNNNITNGIDQNRYIILAEIDSNGYFARGLLERFMIKDLTPYKLSLHRGGFTTSTIPENTYPSMWLGCQFGCDMFEVDVRETSDGELILSHLSYLVGSVGGVSVNWNINEHTLTEFKTMVLANDNIFGDIYPMSLSECLDLAGKYGVNLNLDIKTFCQRKCTTLVVNSAMSGHVAYNINVWDDNYSIEELKQADPQAKFVTGYHPEVWYRYEEAGFTPEEIIIWAYDYEVTSEMANNVHAAGYNFQIDINTADNLPTYVDGYHPDIIETANTSMVVYIDAVIALRNSAETI